MRKAVVLIVALALVLGFGGLSLTPSQAQKDKDKGAVFEVYKDKSDEFRFRLVDGEPNSPSRRTVTRPRTR